MNCLQEIQQIISLVGGEIDDNNDDLLHNIAALKSFIENSFTSQEKIEEKPDDDCENDISNVEDISSDLLDLDGITDEKEILEVNHFI